MDEIQVFLQLAGAPAGGEIIKMRLETEPDGAKFVVALIDYGIGGIKKFRVAEEDVDAVMSKSPPPDLPTPSPSLKGGEFEAEEGETDEPVDFEVKLPEVELPEGEIGTDELIELEAELHVEPAEEAPPEMKPKGKAKK